MNRHKKLISLFCVLMLALSLLPVAFAEGVEYDPPITLYVKASDTPVFASWSKDSEILGYLAANEAVLVYKLGNTARILYEGVNGYVFAEYLTAISPNPPEAEDPEAEMPEPPAPTHTLKKAADLLDSPSTSGTAIASLPAGTEVAVIFVTTTNWARVAAGDKLGYLPASALTEMSSEGSGEIEDGGEDSTPSATAKVKGGSLALRSTPERKASNLIEYIPNGTEVKVLEKANGWAKVQVKGKTGYMMLSYLEFVKDEEPTEPATGDEDDLAVLSECTVYSDNNGPVALRKGPSKSKAIIDFFPVGSVARLHKREGLWSQVTIDGKTGYMMSEFLKDKPVVIDPGEDAGEGGPADPDSPSDDDMPETDGTPMYVKTGNSGGLALRSSPKKTASNLLAFYANDTLVRVLGISGDWAQVKVDGKSGYMMKSMLSLTPAAPATNPDAGQDDGQTPETPAEPSLPATMTVKHPNNSFVNLRSTATDNSNANIIGKIESGTVVEVLGVNGPFTKIRVGDQEGYMNSSYLK